jgi:hypothetical protein
MVLPPFFPYVALPGIQTQHIISVDKTYYPLRCIKTQSIIYRFHLTYLIKNSADNFLHETMTPTCRAVTIPPCSCPIETGRGFGIAHAASYASH